MNIYALTAYGPITHLINMTNEITIFNNPAFGEVRTAGTADKPLFCLADICKAVDLTNPSSVKARLDSEDVQLVDLHALNSTEGRNGNSFANFVTESGLYDVMLQSSSPKVKPFRKWVTSEVLPSIRKHGAYMTEATLTEMLSTPEGIGRLLATLKDEQEKAKALATAVNTQRGIIDGQQKTLTEQRPKVVFADAVVGSTTSIPMSQLAKILSQNGVKNMGQNRLYQWLRDHGYVGKSGAYYNLPMQRYVEQGLFTVRTSTFSKGSDMCTANTTRVTGKGQQYFINLFLDKQGDTASRT